MKKMSIVASRQQSIMGAERVIDAVDDIPRPQDTRAIAGGDARRNVETAVPTVTPILSVVPMKRRRGRPTNAEIAARKAAAGDGVALKSVEHPSPEYDDHDFGDAVETVEIEVPDRRVTFADDVPLPPKSYNAGVSYYQPLLEKLDVGGFVHIAYNSRPVSVNGHLRRLAARVGIKVVVKEKFAHNGRLGTGIWRVQ